MFFFFYLFQSGAQVIIKQTATNQNIAVETDFPKYTFSDKVSTLICYLTWIAVIYENKKLTSNKTTIINLIRNKLLLIPNS